MLEPEPEPEAPPTTAAVPVGEAVMADGAAVLTIPAPSHVVSHLSWN